MSNILIIVDQRGVRNSIKEILEYEKHTTISTASGAEALDVVSSHNFDAIIYGMSSCCDVDIYSFISRCSKESLAPFIAIADSGKSAQYRDRVGGLIASVLERPLSPSKVISTLKRVAKPVHKSEPTTATRVRTARMQYSDEDMVGNSPAIIELRRLIDKVAVTDSRVLIVGANGTGKELVAKRIHMRSLRKDANFVELNCAAIPSELIESEMFGHEKGSFTSACSQRKGKFEIADGGTLFMDEIGDMTLSAQAKVLRALQERRITRIGSDKDIDVNVRVVAATNKCLPKEIANGNFREDLYHRLGVIILRVPSLKDRREDIPLLVSHFIKIICSESNIPLKGITPEALHILTEQPWSGNIRELRNVIERLIVFSEEDEITPNEVKQYVLKEYYG